MDEMIQAEDFKPVAKEMTVTIGQWVEPLWDQFCIPTYGLVRDYDKVRFLIKGGRWYARCAMCRTDLVTCLEARTTSTKVTATSLSLVKQHTVRRYHLVAKLNYLQGVRDASRQFAAEGDASCIGGEVPTVEGQGPNKGDAYRSLVSDIKKLADYLMAHPITDEVDLVADATPTTCKSLSRLTSAA
jgi:hypothetical protein